MINYVFNIVYSLDGQNFILPAVHNFGAYKYFFTIIVCRILLPSFSCFYLLSEWYF